ncbi:MAG: hypothetical protein FK733_07245 [Asgard group archaeon]|nr:hypothetical protein [Asgard group archaeon]
MDEMQFGDILDELKNIKKILVFQSIENAAGIMKPEAMIEYLRSFDLDDKEIKLFLSFKFGDFWIKKALKLLEG